MTSQSGNVVSPAEPTDDRVRATAARGLVIVTTAFLTLIDLFAVQSVLPSLARRFDVTAADMALAANACTLGMALSSLAMALWGNTVNRRNGIVFSLALLALPTAALAFVPDLLSFAMLRILQGVLMAAAFTLMLAHLGEHFLPSSRALAFSAFITGNVLSNLVGRIASASVADQFGLPVTFFAFAGLNLAGAALVAIAIGGGPAQPGDIDAKGRKSWHAALDHLGNAALRSAFFIGFLILFAFIGVFSFINFVLARPPFALDPMAIGWVYLVFLPSLPTTLLIGRLVRHVGARWSILIMLALAFGSLFLMAAQSVAPVLAGLALAAIGTFGAQAAATGYVGSAAMNAKSAASGLYLASYFLGGLAGSLLIGLVFDQAGWVAALAVIGIALVLAAALTRRLT